MMLGLDLVNNIITYQEKKRKATIIKHKKAQFVSNTQQQNKIHILKKNHL